MAAEEFTRASRVGRRIPASGGAEPPVGVGLSELPEILGEFADAICVVEVICLALEGAQEETPDSVAPFAVSLRQAILLINQAYERFDLALLALNRDGDEEIESDDVTS